MVCELVLDCRERADLLLESTEILCLRQLAHYLLHLVLVGVQLANQLCKLAVISYQFIVVCLLCCVYIFK